MKNNVADTQDRFRTLVKDHIKANDRPEYLFKIDSKRAVLVIIDMQNFVCVPGGSAPFPGMESVMKTIDRLAADCRKHRVPVVWVRHNITLGERGNNAGLYGLFHRPDSLKTIANLGEGTRIAGSLSYDGKRDHEVFKNRYSAFLSRPPELENLLKRLGRDQLIISGVAANVCVESTLRDAMQLDYEVILASDGVATLDPVLLEATLVNTRLFFGDVRTTEEIMKELAR